VRAVYFVRFIVKMIFFKKKPVNIAQANVGIFFFVNGEIAVDMTSLEKGELYGDTVGFSDHYEYWQTLTPQNSTEMLFKNHPYDYFPRGRVVYLKKSGRFIIYADHCLKKAEIKKVAEIFQLPAYRLVHLERYQCSRSRQK